MLLNIRPGRWWPRLLAMYTSRRASVDPSLDRWIRSSLPVSFTVISGVVIWLLSKSSKPFDTCLSPTTCICVLYIGTDRLVKKHWPNDIGILFGSHCRTLLSVIAFCFGRHVCHLSVPRQISKIKRNRREISSSLYEILVAEQDHDITFCTRRS